MVVERMRKRFAGAIWEVGRNFILHQELFERCKHAMEYIKAGKFAEADQIMKELPATKAIWAYVLK